MVWDGTRKRPMMLFSDMGGIDIEEVAERHPDHVGRGHLSNLHADLRLPGQAGDRRRRRHRLGAQPRDADPRPARPAERDCDMTLAEINPLARLEDGSFVALDAHMEMEDEAAGRQKALLAEWGSTDDEPASPMSRASSSAT